MLKLAKALLGVHYVGLISFTLSIFYLIGQKPHSNNVQDLFQAANNVSTTSKNQEKIVVFTRIFRSKDHKHTLDSNVKMVRRQFKVIGCKILTYFLPQLKIFLIFTALGRLGQKNV